MAVRAVRGATQIDADEREQLLEATAELVEEVLKRNGLVPDDLISVVLTATPDITCEFPAYAARMAGLALPGAWSVLPHARSELRAAPAR